MTDPQPLPTDRSASRLKPWLWFVLIWIGSVCSLAVVAWLLRTVIRS